MRFYFLNMVGLGLLTAAHLGGFLMPLFLEDQTGITAGIFVVFLVGLFFAFRRDWAWLELIVDTLPMLGLLGTLWGLKIALAGHAGGDFEARDLGIDAAVNTTIVALLGVLWLVLNRKVIKC